MEIADGKIVSISRDGLTIHVPYASWDRLTLRQYDAVQVCFPDGRTISPGQRKRAYACMAEISKWSGMTPEYIKRLLKARFVQSQLTSLKKSLFSLSDCDVTTAREFISYLIDFMIEYDVPSKVPLYELCEDIERYVYTCLMHKQCAVCGTRTADLHHFDQIGMGNDRTKVYQIGMRVISLCRICHGAAHDKGRAWLTETLHLVPIPMTDDIARRYGLTKRNREKA